MRRLTQLRLDDMLAFRRRTPSFKPEESTTNYNSRTLHDLDPRPPPVPASRPARFTPCSQTVLAAKFQKTCPRYNERIKAIFSRPPLRERLGHLCSPVATLTHNVGTAIQKLAQQGQAATKANLLAYLRCHLDEELQEAEFAAVQPSFDKIGEEYRQRAAPPPQARPLRALQAVKRIFDRRGVSSLFYRMLAEEALKQRLRLGELDQLLEQHPDLFQARVGESNKKKIITLRRDRLPQELN